MQVEKVAQKSVFQKYAEELIKYLPMEDSVFTSELCKQELLSGDIMNKIEAMPTQAAKACYFLDNVIKPALNDNDVSSFNNLLSAMEHCDNVFLEALVFEIKSDLNKGSDDEAGMYVILIAIYNHM